MHRLPLIVSGIIFLLFAIVHLLRLIEHWEVTVAGNVISMSVSTIGLVLGILLALWMFTAASRS